MVSSLTFAALAALSILPISAADSDATVSLYMPYVGPQGQYGQLLAMSNLQASIISADSTARTYDLKCISTRLCSIPVPFTLTQGLDIIQYTATNPDTRASGTTTVTCTYTSSAGSCEATIVDAGGAYGYGAANGLYNGNYDNLKPATATVTAGQSYLSQNLQPAATAPGSGASSPSPSVSGGASGNNARASGSATSRSSTGGAAGARPTGQGVLVGGAVAGVAAMAMAL